MNEPVIRYDDKAKALYGRVLDVDIERTIAIADSVFVDVTEDGKLAGIELLDTDSPFLAAPKDLSHEVTLGDLLRLTRA